MCIKERSMKIYNKFAELDKEIDYLCEQKRYDEAMALYEKGVKALPEQEVRDNSPELIWTRAVLNTLLGKYGECFDVIKESVDMGFPFPLHFKRFEPLKQMTGYQDLLEKNEKLINELKKTARPEYVVHLPQNYNPLKRYPLFIALHGHGMCNNKEFSRYWKPDAFLAQNFIFAYVQSSQVICKNGYGWLDSAETSRRDIKECYDRIAKKYSIDDGSILIGGFSGGAITSVDFTLSNIIPIRGFIALCPEIKPEAFTKENVEVAAARGVRGVFMEGELVLPIKCEEEMLDAFKEAGLSCKYYVNKGKGHEAPNDLDDKLKMALEYILKANI
jgi:predicted esterase